MYINIFILFIILLLTFIIIWKDKNELLKSLFYTIYFIIALWINIPCFVNISYTREIDNTLIMIPFKFNNEYGMFYIIFANIILGTLLFLQAQFSDNNTCTYKMVKKQYDNFGNDAIELYVIGRDLDFLGKKNFEKQTDRIIHLGNSSKLLCELTTNSELLALYEEVRKKGVEVRFYNKADNITNLKGQIKLDHSGNKKAIFMSRIDKKYLLINIENQFLVSSILEQYNKVYDKSCP